MEKCKSCGGFGLDLITIKEGICIHCARSQCLFFNPSSEPLVTSHGYVDISPKADGGILKKTITLGTPGKIPSEGCLVSVQYVGRIFNYSSSYPSTDAGTNIFGTTRDVINGKNVGGTDDPFEFRLGHGKVIAGWDIAVASMNTKELSSFIISPAYAYGTNGFAPKVEPNATLEFEIELTKVSDESLPKFPTQSELDDSRKNRLEEETREFIANPPPSIEERVKDSIIQKEKGNALVSEKKYKEAKDAYDSAFIYVYVGKEEFEKVLTAEEQILINKTKLPLYLNRALCKIKLKLHEDALWDVDQALEIDSQNVKAHYRRGLIYIAKIKKELEKEKNKQFWQVEVAQEYVDTAKACFDAAGTTSTSTVLQELDACEAHVAYFTKKYEKDQRKLYKDRIIKGMDKQNNKTTSSTNTTTIEDEFADMPALSDD